MLSLITDYSAVGLKPLDGNLNTRSMFYLVLLFSKIILFFGEIGPYYCKGGGGGGGGGGEVGGRGGDIAD